MPQDYSQFLPKNPYYDIHPQDTQELPDASYLQAFYREMGGKGKQVNPFYIVGGEINLDEQVRLMKEFAETKNDAKLASRFALEEATKDSLRSHQEETDGDLREALQMEQALAHSKIMAAEEEQKAQESLQKKVELAKSGGYIAKNYKEIFKFMNNASSFFGFGEIVDENNAIIKHTAHGFHALTSLWGSYLSKDVTPLLDTVAFATKDYGFTKPLNQFVPCSSEMLTAGISGLTSFNPTHAATSALLAGAKCGIQQYGVSDEYNSILPVIDLMQTGMKMLTPTNIAMEVVSGMSVTNQVLDLYNAETNLFETISGTISNFFSTEEHILG